VHGIIGFGDGAVTNIEGRGTILIVTPQNFEFWKVNKIH
jgi:hypothetical protein